VLFGCVENNKASFLQAPDLFEQVASIGDFFGLPRF
jgi:hypothetical protein